MPNIQYVIDENGATVAVQIPIQEWKLIKAELEQYDSDFETAEILADAEFLASVIRGGEQVKQRKGKSLSDVST